MALHFYFICSLLFLSIVFNILKRQAPIVSQFFFLRFTAIQPSRHFQRIDYRKRASHSSYQLRIAGNTFSELIALLQQLLDFHEQNDTIMRRLRRCNNQASVFLQTQKYLDTYLKLKFRRIFHAHGSA